MQSTENDRHISGLGLHVELTLKPASLQETEYPTSEGNGGLRTRSRS
jgi:hypothetical protein